jgi:hypothetical protein
VATAAVTDRRVLALRAALGFLQLPPRAPKLRLLHRWLDTLTGVGLITVGVDGPVVWVDCEWGARITRRVAESDLP